MSFFSGYFFESTIAAMLGATMKKSRLSLENRHLDDEDKGLLTEEGVYRAGHHSPAWRWYHHAWLAATAINVLLAGTSIYAITTSTRCSPHSQGWDTELLDARGAIQYEERIYTGALTFDRSKGGAVRLNDGEMEFFGPPSAAIDASWEYLLHDEFPVMTEKEAEPFLPELMPLRKDHRYHFEPDMFHNLHCVNAVRLELSKTLYNSTGTPDYHHHQELPDSLAGPGWKVAHLEHCLDRLRQAVMCHGDLTPSPLYRFEGYSVALGKSGNHTCRKFEPIRQWMDSRARSSGL